MPKLTFQFPERKRLSLFKLITGIILLSVITCRAQGKSNLQVFNLLVDSSIVELSSLVPDTVRNINLDLEEGTYSVFNSRVISDLTGRGYTLVKRDSIFSLQYVISEASTSYGDIFRDGLLGDYFVSRRLTLSGSGNLSGRTITTHNFNFTFQDTVAVDSVDTYENTAWPFTHGRLPTEPFFSGILEPVIAVGTAALAVILFFTIRSK